MNHLICVSLKHVAITILITFSVRSPQTWADDIVQPTIMLLPKGAYPQSLAAGSEGVIGFRNGGLGGKHAWNWLRVFPDKRATEIQSTYRDGTFGVALPKREQSLVYYQHENTFRLFDMHDRLIKEARWSGGFVISVKGGNTDKCAVVHSIDSKEPMQRGARIAVVDLETLNISRTIEGWQPAIMVDADAILFYKLETPGTPGTLRESVLYRTDSSLTSTKTVRNFTPPLVQPTVSADGRFIAGVLLTGKEDDQPLVLFDTQSDSMKILSDPGDRCTEPLFCPSELNVLAYRVRMQKNDARTAEALVVHSLDRPRVVVEANPRRFSESYCWSHDGTTLFWVIDKADTRSESLLKCYRIQEDEKRPGRSS